jgi:hypothetical protein
MPDMSRNWQEREPYPLATQSSHGSKVRKIRDTILDTPFAVLLLGILGVVMAYFKDGSDSGFNRFFNSNTFGPKFFMTAIGSMIAINWKRLDRGKQISLNSHESSATILTFT